MLFFRERTLHQRLGPPQTRVLHRRECGPFRVHQGRARGDRESIRYHRKAMPSLAHPEYQSLQANDRRPLLLLIPILRLADNLGRAPERRNARS